MTDYKSYLSTIIRQSLSNDMELYQNVYQKVKPTLLSGNALICANRCSMELLGNVKEYNMTITNYGLLSLKGSGSTKVSGSIQSDIADDDTNFIFDKILFFNTPIHKIGENTSEGEIHIIFKDTKSKKYQVNCVLYNKNNITNNDLLAQKLMDEYVLENIPDKSKNQKSIKKIYSNWYLTDIVPNEQSYYSYILSDNNNVLMVLYEKPIFLSEYFIEKVQIDVFDNKDFTFNYENLDDKTALFYTYDSMIDNNERDICKNIETFKEPFADDVLNDNGTDDNVEIVYDENLNSNEFKSMINQIEDDNQIKENLTSTGGTGTLEYDSAILNSDDCNSYPSRKKGIFITVMVILGLFVSIFLYVIYDNLYRITLFKQNRESKVPLLDKGTYLKMFFKNLFSGQGRIAMISLSLYILSFSVFHLIYLISSFNNQTLFVFSVISLVILFIVIIIFIYKIFGKSLTYLINDSDNNGLYKSVIELIRNQPENNQTNQQGGVGEENESSSGNDLTNKYENIYLGIIQRTGLVTYILDNWINKRKESKIMKLFNQEYYNTKKEDIEDIINTKNSLKRKDTEINNLIRRVNNAEKTTDFKNKEKEIFSEEFKNNYLNVDIKQILMEKFVDNVKYEQQQWNTIVDIKEDYKMKAPNGYENQKEQFNEYINSTKSQFESYKNGQSQFNQINKLINDINEQIKKEKEPIGQIVPPPSQSGGFKKRHDNGGELYQSKKIRNDKIVRSILKNISKN